MRLDLFTLTGMRVPLDGTILITGASSGIGREIAIALAGKAKHLVLVARREERLESLREALTARHSALTVSVLSCNLADAAARDQLLAQIEGEIGTIDVLVNNAGLGDICLFERSDSAKLQQMIDLNVSALTDLTYRLLPAMLANRRGGILNVSSGFGLVWMPVAGVYGATKHYVTALSESLRSELRGTGVVVSQLCPGPVQTEFMENAGNPVGRDTPALVTLKPEHVARVTVRQFARGKAIIMPGFWVKVMMTLGRISPRVVLRAAFSWIGRYVRRRKPNAPT